jgi:hypothetical protein
MAKARVNFRFDSELLAEMHAARGETTLTEWLETAARERLERDVQPATLSEWLEREQVAVVPVVLP